jgi:hypothetical protein
MDSAFGIQHFEILNLPMVRCTRHIQQLCRRFGSRPMCQARIIPVRATRAVASDLRNLIQHEALSRTQTRGAHMSDPRFERDPNLSRNRSVNRESTAGAGSVWIAVIVAVLVVAGIAAYSYRGDLTASNAPATTSGQSTRTPVSTPPATPVAPAPRP